MKIYCGMNMNGIWKASFDESRLGNFDNVFVSDVETVHGNKVYMIERSFGCDCDRDGYFDTYRYVRKAFHSVSEAKKNMSWAKWERLAKENPKEYHVTPLSIISKDFGDPFMSDELRSKQVNIKIIGVHVI